MRTSVTALVNETSNWLLPPPRKCTSITLVFGGKRTWSGGYFRVGLHAALFEAGAVWNPPGRVVEPGPAVNAGAWTFRFIVDVPTTPQYIAETVNAPPYLPAH